MNSLIPWKGEKAGALDRFWEDPWEGFMSPMLRGMWSEPGKSVIGRMPAIDVAENAKEVTVRAELPGMTNRDVKLSYAGGVLTISGEKKEEQERRKKGEWVKECAYGSFTRQVPLGEGVVWPKVTAKFRNGVLTVTAPKKKAAPGQKRVQVKVQ